MNVLLNCNPSTKLQFTEPGSRKLFIESSHTERDVGHRRSHHRNNFFFLYFMCLRPPYTGFRCFYAVAGTQSLEK